MEQLKNRHTYVTIESPVCNLLEVEMKKKHSHIEQLLIKVFDA